MTIAFHDLARCNTSREDYSEIQLEDKYEKEKNIIYWSVRPFIRKLPVTGGDEKKAKIYGLVLLFQKRCYSCRLFMLLMVFLSWQE